MKTAILRRLVALLLCSSSSLAAAQGALVWSDDFNQPDNSAPDPAKWTYDLGGGGWGNSELETYTNTRDNSFIAADPAAEDGHALMIRAVKSATGAYTSARLKTQGLFSARYGRIEARLKSTNGQGLWPAFWVLGDSISTVGWPACGEIDIMEIINANPTTAYGTLHGPNNSGSYSIGNTHTLPNGATYDTAYHVFAVDWSPDKIVWSVDDIVYHTMTPASLPAGARWVFNDAGFFVILNLAIGGNWPGSPTAATSFPQSLAVDYVRVYALPPAAPANLVALAQSPTKIALAWNAAVNPDHSSPSGYRVQRATDAGFTQNVTTFDTTATTSFVDHTAAPAGSYFYRIYTLSGDGISDPTNAVSVATPAAATSPESQAVAAGGTASVSVVAAGLSAPSYQWRFNGADLTSATNATLSISNFGPAASGLYSALVTSGAVNISSAAVVLGLATTDAVAGDGEVLGTDIVHPNGNHFDQVLLTGPAESITANYADHRVTRTSYIDLNDDIVQVEFAGRGTLSLVLASAGNPAPPLKYNQSINYVKGHAGIVIVGADETTNVSVFTVGRATAFDPTGRYDILQPISGTNDPANNGSPLFSGHTDTAYDGIADIAFVAIVSNDGKFGALRTANASYWADAGFTGVYAPGVAFQGPVYLGELDARGTATPVIILGSAGDVRVTGGSLLQSNAAPVQVSGLTQLQFAAGSDSAGNLLPAQRNQAILEEDGRDVTDQVVVNPPI
ncbi:MAG TPA: family 16 glycosylhydrolase [Opitutus sp.]|nr:family 16 glycosylhydrolase [Opitutus sp.]